MGAERNLPSIMKREPMWGAENEIGKVPGTFSLGGSTHRVGVEPLRLADQSTARRQRVTEEVGFTRTALPSPGYLNCRLGSKRQREGGQVDLAPQPGCEPELCR